MIQLAFLLAGYCFALEATRCLIVITRLLRRNGLKGAKRLVADDQFHRLRAEIRECEPPLFTAWYQFTMFPLALWAVIFFLWGILSWVFG